MRIPDGIAASAADLTQWRQAIHADPELGFEEHHTAGLVAELLRSFGVDEVHERVAGTGVVAIIRAGTSDRRIALRADLDALPMEEAPEIGQRPHRSHNGGVMHACGHDGHTVMLLGAARELARNRTFDGTVVLVFQPAEEVLDFGKAGGLGRGGAVAMIEGGFFERFPVDAMFGMHNRPQLAVGAIQSQPGPVYAAVDRFEIRVRGRGGHAARPHLVIDPVPVAARLIGALQGIASRAINPFEPVVLSVCKLSAGTAFNVIPDDVQMSGTVRTFDEAVRTEVEAQMHRICDGIGAAAACTIELDYQRGHPALINDPACVDLALKAAASVVGADNVGSIVMQMGGEDFAHFAAQVPSAYVVIGNGTTGDHARTLHNAHYDFNDAVLPVGAAYWTALVGQALPIT